MTDNKDNSLEMIEDGVMISSLVNAHMYSLHRAFIIKDSIGYELVFTRKGAFSKRVRYKTLKGARIAFREMMLPHYKEFSQTQVQKKMAKAEWSPFYTPEPGWFALVLSEVDETDKYRVNKNEPEQLIKRKHKGRKPKGQGVEVRDESEIK